MTAVSMVVIAGIIATNDGDVNKALPIILAVFLLAGLMQIGLGALGLGKYIRYIPLSRSFRFYDRNWGYHITDADFTIIGILS